MREFRAALPLPPGLNASYKLGYRPNGQPVLFTSPRADGWKQDAVLLLRAAGFRRLPAGAYWCSAELAAYTRRQDVDAGVKATLDAIAAALGIDDAAFGRVVLVKIPVDDASDERLEVLVHVETVDDRQAFIDRCRAELGAMSEAATIGGECVK